MSLISQLENVFETLVEGSFRRFFGAPLQPIEVARALERVMMADRVVGAATVDVPNRYVAYVNPVEFQRLDPLRSTVERDAAIHLERRASEQDYHPIGPIRVELAADPSVPRSTVRAEARFEEGTTIAVESVEHTRRLELIRPQARTDARSLVIVGEDGETTRLDSEPLRIGRGPENDLVIPDVRVSRYHAVIEPATEGWVIRDLSSTNGTYLDGERVAEARLDAMAELSLGGYQLALRPG
jgi:hypothetical protein